MSEIKQMFVLSVGVLDNEHGLEMVQASVEHWVENATLADYKKGFLDIPEGEGPIHLLLARECVETPRE